MITAFAFLSLFPLLAVPVWREKPQRRGWTIEKASPSAASVIFIDPTRTSEFIVTVSPNPNANSATSVALDPLLQSMQAKPHYQQVDLAPTTTVGGATWDQIGAIGDVPYSGQPLSTKVIAMAINRPAHDASTKMYKIQFSAPAKDFDQMESMTFQPMLQSFRNAFHHLWEASLFVRNCSNALASVGLSKKSGLSM